MKNEIFGPHSLPVYRDYAADIHNSCVHLLNLINEILDLWRIETGRYELNEEAVSLARVFEDCHHLLKLRTGRLRIGTEAIVTFPPERVMAALAPIADRARPLQPQADVSSASKRKEMPILKRY